MPITSIASYEPTTLDFEVNWEEANTELAPSALTLMGNYGGAQFTADRATILAAINDAAQKGRTARSAADDYGLLKAALIPRVTQFRGAVLGKVPDEAIRNRLPVAPKITSDYSKFETPLQTVVELWGRVNDNAEELQLSEPLTLVGGYTLAQFETDTTRLGTLNTAAERAEEKAGLARAHRDTLLKEIYNRMKQYRQAAPSILPKSSDALKRLPRLTPEPGTTPPPLVVKARWDEASGKAILDWEGLSAEVIAKYSVDKLQLRGCTGATYKGSNEEIIATFAPNATHAETDFGLTVPGAIASFKVYVMTSTGNENGGKAAKVVRPDV